MVNSAPTLVCFAVKEEARSFKRLAAGHGGIELVVTGMGQKNTLNTLRAAVSRLRPGRVITAGFAGGLSPELARGAVVFSADPATGLEARLLAAGAQRARFYCADRVITTAAEKRDLWSSTGSDVVEMESQFIRAFCAERQVPAATVRVILDTATEDLVLDFNQLMTPAQKIDLGKLALVLCKSPGKIPALVRLQRQSAEAARQLGTVLAAALL